MNSSEVFIEVLANRGAEFIGSTKLENKLTEYLEENLSKSQKVKENMLKLSISVKLSQDSAMCFDKYVSTY